MISLKPAHINHNFPLSVRWMKRPFEAKCIKQTQQLWVQAEVTAELSAPHLSATPPDTLSTVGATSAEQGMTTTSAKSTKKCMSKIYKKIYETTHTTAVAHLHMPISWNDPPSPPNPSFRSKTNQCTYNQTAGLRAVTISADLQHTSACIRIIIQVIIKRLEREIMSEKVKPDLAPYVCNARLLQLQQLHLTASVITPWSQHYQPGV